jgi:hypothetical protein
MRTSNTNRRSGLLGATTKVVSFQDCAVPATVTLTSADASRKVELTTDGINFYLPTYTLSPAAFIQVVVEAPILAIKFTGLSTDTYTIL